MGSMYVLCLRLWDLIWLILDGFFLIWGVDFDVEVYCVIIFKCVVFFLLLKDYVYRWVFYLVVGCWGIFIICRY